jgi:hypothetical protein
MKKIYINVESMENEGCNNGNYPAIYNRETGEYLGNVCRCGRGCSNTEKLYLSIEGGYYIISE